MACCNNNTTSCNTCNTCNTCGCNSGISFQNDLWIWIIVIALVVILFAVG